MSNIRNSAIITSETDAAESESPDELQAPGRSKADENVKKEQSSLIKPWYRKTRYWVVCLAILLVLAAVLIPLMFLVIFPSIVKRAIDNSLLNLDYLEINLPITNNSFNLTTKGSITNAGPVKADVRYQSPVTVRWNNTTLGNVTLPDFTSRGGSAQISNQAIFNIQNTTAFGEFTKVQLNDPNFTWTLSGTVSVHALGITKNGLSFVKEITLPGGNGFKGTNVTDYRITNTTDPTAISGQYIATSLNNPSPIEIYVGTFGIDIYYSNALIGPAEATNLTIRPGNNNVTFVGSISPNLTIFILADLLSRYITNQSIPIVTKGAYAKPNGVDSVDWLTEGVQALEIQTYVYRA